MRHKLGRFVPWGNWPLFAWCRFLGFEPNSIKEITFTTFDPEILLGEPENKKLSWEDLKKFRNEIYKNL